MVLVCWQWATSTTKNVLNFVCTKGAQHTEPGMPYVTKWKDKNLTSLSRDIPRPEVVSKYVQKPNLIDVNNQLRQDILALEKDG